MSFGVNVGIAGLFVIGSIILFQAADHSAAQKWAESEQRDKQRAQFERIAKGTAACDRTATPPAEARAPRDANDSLEDMSSSIDLISAKLEVSNTQSRLDEAVLTGNSALEKQLRRDLQNAKGIRDEKQVDSERRSAIRYAHEQALQDIKDCREFRGGN